MALSSKLKPPLSFKRHLFIVLLPASQAFLSNGTPPRALALSLSRFMVCREAAFSLSPLFPGRARKSSTGVNRAVPRTKLSTNSRQGTICPEPMRPQTILTAKDVVRLLRQMVAEAGGQSAWARKTGIHRSVINMVLQEQRAPTKAIINALQLEVVYLPRKRRRPTRGKSQPKKRRAL